MFRGCRRAVLASLLVLVLFHASVSPVLASNIGTDQVLDTYQPDITIVPKPQLVPQTHSSPVQTPRNPDGSVLGSPYENVPDSQLTTAQVAAKYGVSVGQLAKPSTWDNIKAFAGDMYASGKEKWKSFTSWLGGKVTGKSTTAKTTGKGGGKGGKNGKAAKNTTTVIASTAKQSPESCSKSLSRSLYEALPDWLKWTVNKTSGAPSADCKKSDSPSVKTTITKKATEFKKSTGDALSDLWNKATSTKKKLTEAWNDTKSTVSFAANGIVGGAKVVANKVTTTVSNAWENTNKNLRSTDISEGQKGQSILQRVATVELKIEMGVRYHALFFDTDKQWTLQEMQLSKQILSEIYIGDFSDNKVLTFTRGKMDKDQPNACGTYFEDNASMHVYDSSFECRLEDIAPKVDPSNSALLSQLSFKRVLSHELTHAYQAKHQSESEQFANLTFKKIEVKVTKIKNGEVIGEEKQSLWTAKDSIDKPEKTVTDYADDTYTVRIGTNGYREEYDPPIALPQEDEAESVAMYINNPSLLKRISEKKYDVIKNNVFNGYEFPCTYVPQ